MSSQEDSVKLSRREFVTSALALPAIAYLSKAAAGECITPQPSPETRSDKTKGPSGKIAFVEWNHDEENKEGDLWIVNADGTGLKKLRNGVKWGSKVRFSPDGKLLAFEADTWEGSLLELKGKTSEFQITDLDGKVLHHFESCSGGDGFSWSQDGKSIFYDTYSSEAIFRYGLESRTNEIIACRKWNRSINKYCPHIYPQNPTPSPGGDLIAFVIHIGGSSYDVVLMRLGNNKEEIIASGKGTNHDETLDLEWIDADRLIFKVDPKNLVYCADTKTKEVKEINPNVYFSSMRLSPDKSELALYGGKTVHILKTKELLSGSANPADTKISSDAFAWSPQGDYFAVQQKRREEDNTVVYLSIFDREGKEYKVLEKLPEPAPLQHLKSIDWVKGG